MNKERRKHKRVEMEMPVTLRTQGRLLPASTVNVSLGGVCLLTDYNEKISEGLTEVLFDLPKKLKDVSLTGKILRFEKGIGQKVAVQFTRPFSKGHQTLTKFLLDYLR